ncbi:hypothetical protein BVRB_027210, partial [Beta vulgaris subsp. vulgaris]
GERFQGITGIPAGPHYLYYSAPDHGAGNAISSGRFLYFDANDDVWVGEWNPETEEILPVSDRDQALRYCHGVKAHDFTLNLGRYPEEMSLEWATLSLHISRSCMLRLSPIGSVIRPTQAPDAVGLNSDSACKTYYTELEIGMSHGDPVQVTADNLDKSRLLEKVVELRLGGDYDAVLGELQFAFIAFMLGQSYEGFVQWKKLVLILCSCEAAMWDQRLFFDKFVGMSVLWK